MNGFVWLVPVALLMGAIGLEAFLWSMRDGQYDDLDGAAERIFIDTEIDRPLTDPGKGDRSASEKGWHDAPRAKSQLDRNFHLSVWLGSRRPQPVGAGAQPCYPRTPASLILPHGQSASDNDCRIKTGQTAFRSEHLQRS